jgi:hypothetical protein
MFSGVQGLNLLTGQPTRSSMSLSAKDGVALTAALKAAPGADSQQPAGKEQAAGGSSGQALSPTHAVHGGSGGGSQDGSTRSSPLSSVSSLAHNSSTSSSGSDSPRGEIKQHSPSPGTDPSPGSSGSVGAVLSGGGAEFDEGGDGDGLSGHHRGGSGGAGVGVQVSAATIASSRTSAQFLRHQEAALSSGTSGSSASSGGSGRPVGSPPVSTGDRIRKFGTLPSGGLAQAQAEESKAKQRSAVLQAAAHSKHSENLHLFGVGYLRQGLPSVSFLACSAVH